MTDEGNRAVASDAGCWIDGHWGQYGIARMVEIAEGCGYDDAQIIGIAARHMDECAHPGADEGITDDEHQILSDAADEVQRWLTEHVAPTGYWFEWCDGEFFLTNFPTDDYGFGG